ncbi:GGDEF domain-containing protein [Salinispirillum sp. LH 10-3-1]|uniref:diguanylate cyclase n=1 Tax=Salinispirillum sp. LH 10-3-1 TaxID=2952525 RepID=A0AB38YBL6_9GAMM
MATSNSSSGVSRNKKVTHLDLKRPQDRLPERSTSFLRELRLRISSLSQTTLEIEKIVQYFFDEVQAAVHVEGLNYVHEGHNVAVQVGSAEKHRASYRLNTQQSYFGEVTFTRRKRFSEVELSRLESLLDLFVYPVRNGLQYREAVRSALTDPLTGVGNRLGLSNTLQKEIEVSRRYDRPLTIMMLDIDKFKSINDIYGHAVGDRVLVDVTNYMKQTLRVADAVFRLGGEEFLILLADTSLDQAVVIGERIRQNIEQSHQGSDTSPYVTASIGIAAYQADMSSDDLLNAADRAMYSAKEKGRNKIECA